MRYKQQQQLLNYTRLHTRPHHHHQQQQQQQQQQHM
jgi:hypothetical protein